MIQIKTRILEIKVETIVKFDFNLLSHVSLTIPITEVHIAP